MVVAFLNYIFHPLLGRLLAPVAFGDVQALLSLIAQSGIIFGAFSLVVVNITTNIEDARERNAIISALQNVAFYVVGFIFLILVLSISELKSFFNFSSYVPLVGLAVILPISSLSTFRNAYLQGSGNFSKLSLSGIVASLGRLIFVFIFIFLGLEVLGATLGIVMANICVLGYLFYQTRESLDLSIKSDIHILEKGSLKKELVYGVLVLFATSLVTLFYTSDVLIIKHYFSAFDAGLYSGISAIAKILFFAVGPSSVVLLSSVKMRHSFIDNSRALAKSLAISLVVGILGLVAFYLFSDMIIKVMIGSKYVPFAHYLPKAGLVMFLTAFANILVFYFLALRRFFLVGVSLFGIGAMGFILLSGHTSIAEVLNNLLLSLVVITILLITVYVKDYFHYRSSP